MRQKNLFTRHGWFVMTPAVYTGIMAAKTDNPSPFPAQFQTTLRRMKPAYLGYALCLMFSFIYFHDALPLMGATGLGSVTAAVFLALFLFAKVTTFAAFGLLAYRRPLFAASTACTVTSAALLIVGMALSIIVLRVPTFAFGVQESTILLALSGATLGAGDALMLLVWGRFCGTLSLRTTYLFVLLSYLAALAAYTLVVEFPPPVLMACATVGIGIIPMLLGKSLEHRNVVVESPTPAVLKKAANALWRPVLLTALFAFLSNVTLFASGQQSAGVWESQWTSTAVTFIVVLLLFLPLALFPKRMNIGAAYRIALPLSTGGFLLMAFLWNGGGGFANALVAMGWLIADVISWCIVSDAVYETRAPAFLLYGVSEGIVGIGSLMGVGVGFFFAETMGSGTMALMALALAAIYLSSIAIMFILKDRPLPALSRNATDEEDAAPAEPTPIREDRVQATCAALAQRAGLTPREADILGCLAQGRNTQYMAEKFCVSENTVKSHVRNVYRKLDVHSKQDIIDIINSDKTE